MAFDLDTDASGIRKNVELLDSDHGLENAGIGNANIGDIAGEGFDQLNMTASNHGANANDYILVANHTCNIIV